MKSYNVWDLFQNDLEWKCKEVGDSETRLIMLIIIVAAGRWVMGVCSQEGELSIFHH